MILQINLLTQLIKMSEISDWKPANPFLIKKNLNCLKICLEKSENKGIPIPNPDSPNIMKNWVNDLWKFSSRNDILEHSFFIWKFTTGMAHFWTSVGGCTALFDWASDKLSHVWVRLFLKKLKIFTTKNRSHADEMSI